MGFGSVRGVTREPGEAKQTSKMNRANQQRLNQEANQEVINIRQTEISYYINLFTIFGTNAALVGGFNYGILTQNIFAQSSKDFQIYKFVYYVFAAITIATSVHIIVSTMLLQVYGPGLAYFGPLGSMAQAAEGMRQEQKQVISAVMLMVFSFITGTIWLYFCVMTFNGAIISTFLTLVAARTWYYFCERIYLRFYWKVQEGAWNEAPRDSRYKSEDDNPATRQALQDVLAQTQTKVVPPSTYHKKTLNFPSMFGFGSKKKPTGESDDIELEDSSDYKNGVFSYIFRNPARMSEAERESFTSTAPSLKSNVLRENGVHSVAGARPGQNKTPVLMEGYFTTRGRNEQMKLLEARRWERRYFVLYRAGEYYIYQSRQAYRQRPEQPIFTRPLLLIDFFVKVDNADEIARAELDDDTQSAYSDASSVKTGASSPRANRESHKAPTYRFQITLIPRENAQDDLRAQFRNHWILRCDTEEELEIWLSAIHDVCPSCFSESAEL